MRCVQGGKKDKLNKKTSPSPVCFNIIRYEQQMRRMVAFIFSIFARDPRAQFCLWALGRSIHHIKNIHQHSGSSVALEINKAMAINQRCGGDECNVERWWIQTWHDGEHQHDNQTVKDSVLFNYELWSWNKLLWLFKKTPSADIWFGTLGKII